MVEKNCMQIPVPLSEIISLLKNSDSTAGKRFKELVFEQVQIALNKKGG
jgi:hypothetical protein